MKKQTETGEIISIDLDEEKEKEEKQQQVEITAGDMYIRIPTDRSRIREAIAFLQVFEQKLPRQEELNWENPRQQPIYKNPLNLPQITETEQKQITGFPFQNPVIPQPIQQLEPNKDKIVLDQHQTYKVCPKCGNPKLKYKKVQQFQDGLKQVVLCKRCKWTYELDIKI